MLLDLPDHPTAAETTARSPDVVMESSTGVKPVTTEPPTKTLPTPAESLAAFPLVVMVSSTPVRIAMMEIDTTSMAAHPSANSNVVMVN